MSKSTFPLARSADAGQTVTPSQAWMVVRRHRWLIAAVTLASMTAAAAVSWLIRPIYRSESTILVSEQGSGPNLLGELAALKGIGGLGGVGGSSSIANEMAILKSRRMAEGVADSLALRVQLLERGLSRDAVFAQIRESRLAKAGEFELARVAPSRYSVSGTDVERTFEVALGEPFVVAGIRLVLSPELASDPPSRIRFRVSGAREAVEQVQKNLVVSRPERDAEVLKIAYRSPDPALAAQVPNAITRLFIDYKTTSSKTDSRSYAAYLREQADRYEGELRTAEAQLQAFREDAQIISPESQAAEEVRRFAEVKAKQDELRTEREALGQLLAQVRREEQPGDGSSAYRELASYPTLLINPAVQNILQSLVELENQRAELLVTRTERSIDVQGIDRRISDLETSLYRTASAYLESLDKQASAVDEAVGRFTTQLERVPAVELGYVRLLRQQKLLEQIYTLVQTKLKETEMKEAAETDNVRTLDAAIIPARPVFPRPLLNVALAAVFGLLLGSGIVLGRHHLDSTVRTQADLERIAAEVPTIGVIPHIGSDAVVRRLKGRGSLSRATKPSARAGLIPVVGDGMDAHAFEAYRAVRTSLTLGNAHGAPQVLLITSALAGEGKTTTVGHLGAAFARQGVRTLLLDADLRSGRLHEHFGARQGPGLTDLLRGDGTVADVVQELSLPPGAGSSLHLVGAGTASESPSELLGSARMGALLTELRTRYGVILIDTPPSNYFTDAAVLSPAVDAALVIARAGVTEQEALYAALRQLQQMGAPVRGVILNDSEVEDAGYGAGIYPRAAAARTI